MARFNDSVSTFNSLLRTLLAICLVGGVSLGGWVGYQKLTEGDRKQEQLEATKALLAERDEALARAKSDLKRQSAELVAKDQQIGALHDEVAAQAEQIDKLGTALRLLKVDHRIAQLRVVKQSNDPETGELYSDVEFIELNDEGAPIEKPRQFHIRGDVVYIDNWIVKFDDKYVEESDLDRSTSLVLFRRIFGESQNPKDGYALDTIGTRPTAYGRGTPMSEFEEKIWSDFWNIANDETRSKELGIRAAHGEALSIKVEPDKTYRIFLRASDGLSIRPN
jgi:hypothetical protein